MSWLEHVNLGKFASMKQRKLVKNAKELRDSK